MTTKNHNENRSSKKVLKGIIIAIFIFISLSMTATRLIYDFIFKGYDCKADSCANNADIRFDKEEHYYPCGNETIYGYRLKASAKSDSIIVLAPGFNACADEYLPLAQYFVSAGYDMFLFDCVGSGSSTGTYTGFPQEITDLDVTLNVVGKLGYKNIFLLGHSRGGYAVCCNINGDTPVRAAASIGGVNSAMDGLMSTSVNAVGKVAYINYPFLWMYQNELFGLELANMSASDELAKSQTPVLIIHGASDTVIPKDKFSVYSHKNSIKNKNIAFSLYTKDGHDGHTNILFDDDGIANAELMSQIDSFFKLHINKGEN